MQKIGAIARNDRT